MENQTNGNATPQAIKKDSCEHQLRPIYNLFESIRTEHYGAFGIALLVQILCIRHSITAAEGYLNFYIDNDTVIKRLKYGIPQEMGSTKYCKTDYDIWAETIHILESLPCPSAFTHVKGHQDEVLYASCKVRSLLPRLAHYNIEMDRLAGQCMAKA